MKTLELTGALLDYWTARAEGIPAERLEIRRVQRTTEYHCVRKLPLDILIGPGDFVLYNPSEAWHLAGALVEKHNLNLSACTDGETWTAFNNGLANIDYGNTPQVAICRAVVRAAFGDDVEEVAICE